MLKILEPTFERDSFILQDARVSTTNGLDSVVGRTQLPHLSSPKTDPSHRGGPREKCIEMVICRKSEHRVQWLGRLIDRKIRLGNWVGLDFSFLVLGKGICRGYPRLSEHRKRNEK